MLKMPLKWSCLFLLIHTTISETATVVSTPGVQWSRDNSAVQLVWRLDEDVLAYRYMDINKDNLLIIRYDRLISINNYTDPNFTNRVTVIDSSSSDIYLYGINISSLSIYDYGDFCAAFYSAGESCGATVVILGEPSGIDLSGELPVVVGDDVTLRCAAVSTTLPLQFAPVMTYMWNINGTTYSPGDGTTLPERHSFRDADGQLNKELFIASLERDDIYEYTCHAWENGSSFMSEQSNTYSLFPYFSPGSAQSIETQLTINATSDVTLTCTGNELGRPRGSWVWSKPGGGHVNTDTRGDLVIRNASVSGDDGIYSCFLANAAGNGAAGNITVTVNEKPMITEIGEVIVINTDPLNVSCEVRARPAASVVWKFEDGGDLPDDIFRYVDRIMTVGKYAITTSDLMWSVGGQPDDRRGLGRSTIVCKAANAAGASSNTFDLNVQYAPYNVKMNPPEAIVEFGSLGPVLCSASCNPSCSYSWSEGGAQVSSNATLMIHNVTRDDQGVYKCLPDNGIPEGDTAEFSLTVFYGPAVDTFTIGSPNDPIIEGDPIRFTCETDSQPIPVITMYAPRGDVLASSSHNQSLEHTRPNIDCLDAGQYTCQAYNPETGKYHSRMKTATVHCAPRKNRTSAREVAATDGDTVSFNITTVAYPQPAFTWFFNGTELSDVSYTIKTHTMGRLEPGVFISSSLTLSNITRENFGNYTVTARNMRGTMDDVVFLLTAVGVPVGPQHFMVYHANTVSITMQWTSGWNRGLKQVFTLMYRRSDSNDSFTNSTDIIDPGQGETVTSKAVGLLPHTSYHLMVQATNLYGASQSQLVTHSTEVEPNVGSGSFLIVVTGAVATIKWSLYTYSGPITHVDINGCVSDSMNCILTAKVSPKTSTVEVAVAEGGSSYIFEFLVYDGEDLLSRVSHSAKVDGGSSVGIIVGVVVGVMVVIAVAVGGFIYWKRRSQTDVRKDKSNVSELGHVNPVMVTDDDIPLTANGKQNTMSEGHQMVVENTLYASSGPGRDDHMDQPYAEVSVATAGTKAVGEKKKKHKGKKSKQNAVEMNNMYTDSDNTKGKLPTEDTISPYEDVDGTDKPKGAGPVDGQLPMYAEVDRSQKPKKAPELAEYADVDVVKKNKHARKATKADIVEPEVVEYEEVDFKKKSPGAPAAASAGGGVTLGAAALPEYGRVDFSKKHKQESEAVGKPKPPVKGKKPKPGAPPPRPPRAASVDEGKRTLRPPDHQPQYGVEGTLYADLDLINTTPTRTEPTVHANLEPSEYASIDALRLTTRPADQ